MYFSEFTSRTLSCFNSQAVWSTSVNIKNTLSSKALQLKLSKWSLTLFSLCDFIFTKAEPQAKLNDEQTTTSPSSASQCGIISLPVVRGKDYNQTPFRGTTLFHSWGSQTCVKIPTLQDWVWSLLLFLQLFHHCTPKIIMFLPFPHSHCCLFVTYLNFIMHVHFIHFRIHMTNSQISSVKVANSKLSRIVFGGKITCQQWEHT